MPCHLLLASSKSIHDNETSGPGWPTFVCPIWAFLIGRWPCHLWAIKWWPMMNQKWERTTWMINLHIYPSYNFKKIAMHCLSFLFLLLLLLLLWTKLFNEFFFYYQTFFLRYFILKSYVNTVFICFFLYYISFLYIF